MTIALFLHLLSDVIWIGGMFLAYVAVRPAALEVLEPPQRLRLWAGKSFARGAIGIVLGQRRGTCGVPPVLDDFVGARGGEQCGGCAR